jgi:hypothetical protein
MSRNHKHRRGEPVTAVQTTHATATAAATVNSPTPAPERTTSTGLTVDLAAKWFTQVTISGQRTKPGTPAVSEERTACFPVVVSQAFNGPAPALAEYVAALDKACRLADALARAWEAEGFRVTRRAVGGLGSQTWSIA